MTLVPGDLLKTIFLLNIIFLQRVVAELNVNLDRSRITGMYPGKTDQYSI